MSAVVFFVVVIFFNPPGLSFMGDECGKLEETNQQRQFDPTVSYFHACPPAGEAETICFSVIEWRWSCGCPSADISVQHVRGALLIKVVFTHKGKTCGTF